MRSILICALLAVIPSAALAQLTVATASQGKIVPETLVTIGAKGIVPNAISVATGPFMLRIENRSRINTLALSMTGGQATGELLRSSHSQGSPDTSFLLNLLPGTYTFSTVGGGPWVLTITVK